MPVVGVISDVHANREALSAVVFDLPGHIESVLCLGDLVGYGADPAWCINLVRSSGWLTIAGNHDRACTNPIAMQRFNPDAADCIRWTINTLSDDEMVWLRTLNSAATYGGAMLVHGSPRDPTYEYVLDTITAGENLSLVGRSLCFHGHSHVPGIFERIGLAVRHSYAIGCVELGRGLLINPGSVGQPRDGDPDASYGLWDITRRTFEFRRVKYDREATKYAMARAGLPLRLGNRLDRGR